MSARTLEEITKFSETLAGGDPRVIEKSARLLLGRLGRFRGPDYGRAVEALCSLFYIDTADRPDLEPLLDRAAEALAGQGEKIVPLLLAQMQGSDIKSHLYLARTLGKIGRRALPKLRDVLATAEDPYARAFGLYAIGKMTCPQVVEALPEVVGCLMHPDKEVRDSAARTLGKIAAGVPRSRLGPRARKTMFQALMRASRDPQAPVRAKALRSLGKMAVAGLLDRAGKADLAAAARSALGEGGDHVWDAAFIVRREAREALQAVEQ